VTGHIAEGEETVPQCEVAPQAVIEKGVSKSKRMVASFLAAILAPGVFFALRTGKHKEGTPTTGEGKSSVIVHTGTAYQGDMGANLHLEMFASVTLQGERATRAYSLAQIVAKMSSSRYCRSAPPHRDYLGTQWSSRSRTGCWALPQRYIAPCLSDEFVVTFVVTFRPFATRFPVLSMKLTR
jgi:hypothetical protein